MKKPKLFTSFRYFPIALQVQSPYRGGNEFVDKKKTIRQHIKTGVVEALYPQIVGDKKPKEIFVWKPLTPESGQRCLAQVRYLTDRRNSGYLATEKVIRLKKEDFVAA